MIKDEHSHPLELMQEVDEYRQALELYRKAVGPVYFRPVGGAFTVISLDPDCSAMMGVGGSVANCRIKKWPVTESFVESRAEAFREKRAKAEKDSEEERYALSLVREAIEGDFSVGPEGWYFVHQEWRVKGKKLDLLVVEPKEGRLGVIELKKSDEEARRSSTKAGDAWAQAESYALMLWKGGDEVLNYFQQLIRATAVAHDGPDILKNIELNPKVPKSFVSWPGAGFYSRR